MSPLLPLPHLSHLRINLSDPPVDPPHYQLHSILVLKIIKRGNKIFLSSQAEGQFLLLRLETLSDTLTSDLSYLLSLRSVSDEPAMAPPALDPAGLQGCHLTAKSTDRGSCSASSQQLREINRRNPIQIYVNRLEWSFMSISC